MQSLKISTMRVIQIFSYCSAAFFDSYINKPLGKLGFLKRNQNIDTWTAINTNGVTLIDQEKDVRILSFVS